MIGKRLTAKKYSSSRVFIFEPIWRARRSRTSLKMLRRKMNPNTTRAKKLSPESAYSSSRSLDVSTESFFKRSDDCNTTRKVKVPPTKSPTPHGVFLRLFFDFFFPPGAILPHLPPKKCPPLPPPPRSDTIYRAH